MADPERGARLRQARLDAGLTQKEAALQADTTDVSISNWENGANISEPMLDKLATIYRKGRSELRYGGQSVVREEQTESYTPNPALKNRLRPRPRARVYEHIQAMVSAGCTIEQIDEAERLMVDGAYNKLNARDPRDRTDEEMILDIDDAWDWIKEVLGREGVKGLK